MPKVTVYIPAHNYGQFIGQAIESVLRQTMDDWELIVIDDGSTDNTSKVLERYRGHPKIRIVEQLNRGLSVTNNIALRLANGGYLMRLDADDFLDENILLVLSNVLDTKPEIGLVYPDYYLVDEEGEILEVVRRQKIGGEVELLDLPAHGACTMIRKEILLEIGGYYEEFNRQDGYGFWLKFVQRYNPYNVNVPVFYYRQHERNLTKDHEGLLEARRQIKRQFVTQAGTRRPKVLAIVPVIGKPLRFLGAPFTDLAGKPLIAYTLAEVAKAKLLDRVVVSSESSDVLEYAAKHPGIIPLLRPKELTKSTSPVEETILHVLDALNHQEGYQPDAVCICYVNHPFRRAEHIDKAIDTMTIFDVDSVISIQEELSFCYHHGRHGLVPINSSRHRNLHLERKAIFKENGAIYLTRADVVRRGRLLGERIGHIAMLPEESVKLKSEFDFWLAEKIAIERGLKK
jgi:CMP-N-acetylneuraminic acid synthetase